MEAGALDAGRDPDRFFPLFYNIALYCMHGRRGAVTVIIGIFAIFMITVYLTNYHIGWFLLKNTGAALSCLL